MNEEELLEYLKNSPAFVRIEGQETPISSLKDPIISLTRDEEGEAVFLDIEISTHGVLMGQTYFSSLEGLIVCLNNETFLVKLLSHNNSHKETYYILLEPL